MIPPGRYVYEIRDRGYPVATETITLGASKLSGLRVAAGVTATRNEVEADLDSQGFIRALRLRYAGGLFTRVVAYQVVDDQLRGTISAVGGRNAVESKLGRFKEIDAGLVFFKALLAAHTRGRGLSRFTGRVAVINPSTLLARPFKQSLFLSAQDEHSGTSTWILEPAMGERETLVIDPAEVLLKHVAQSGVTAELVSHTRQTD